MTSATRVIALLLLAACAKKPDAAGALRAGDFLVRLTLDPETPRNGARRGQAPRDGRRAMLERSAERQQLIGVVYARVERRPLTLSLRASGRVELDETRVSEVVLKYDAYVERLFAGQTGQHVRKGERLLTLYGPELLSAEQDYLIALRTRGVPGSEQLARAAEERPRRWNLDEAQPADLRNPGKAAPRVTLHTPVQGTGQ